MEFLEIGEKIQKTRKELNMKQRELEDVNITRALISMIEIGKRTPSKENMENILGKFKRKAEELNVPFNLESSYFLSSAKNDAHVYCGKTLSSTTSVDEIRNIIEIARKYELSHILADAYLKLADIRFENIDYINAHVDYLNALDNYKSININERIPYIYNMLGRCCINQVQTIQALNYFNFAYHYSILYSDEEIKVKAIYNLALCNRKLGKLEDVLKYIDICISICDKERDFLIYSYAIILKSNCYDSEGDFTKAIKLLLALLEEFKDKAHPLIGNIYNNLGVLYCKQGIYEKSLQYFNVSEEIRTKKDMKSLSHTLIEKSLIYSQQALYEESVPLIKTSIELASKYKDIEYILKGYYELIRIYKIIKFNEEITNIYLKILDSLVSYGSSNYKEEVVKVCTELLRIFISKNDIQQSISILDKLENVTRSA